MAFQVITESSMLAVLKNQVISRSGFKGLVALNDVGMGQPLMDLKL